MKPCVIHYMTLLSMCVLGKFNFFSYIIKLSLAVDLILVNESQQDPVTDDGTL